tara:strand:- start:43 stop:927 length:885 start_codon:yes stop_codon:yes gene_type:complete
MAKTTLGKIAGAMDTTPYKKKAVDWLKKQEPEDLLDLMMAPMSPFAGAAAGRRMAERASGVPGGTSSKAMSDMLETSKPLPGQAIAIAPDPGPVDPRAAEFQKAIGSMMATPDDYYRWERDQRIAEQDAEQAKADAGWDEYLDRTAGFEELGRREAMEQQRLYALSQAVERMRDTGNVTQKDREFWEGLAKSEEEGDYSESTINQPKPPGYIYNQEEAANIADEILSNPEEILGVDPGWFQGIGENDWGGVAQYIQQQASKDPDFLDNVSTEEFWDHAKEYVKKYNEWLEGAGY